MATRADELTRAICDEIERWSQVDLYAYGVDDGDGRVDFMGYSVSKEARTRLNTLIAEFGPTMPVLEFNRALCPTTNAGSIAMFGKAIADYLRTLDPSYLPPGVSAPDSTGKQGNSLKE